MGSDGQAGFQRHGELAREVRWRREQSARAAPCSWTAPCAATCARAMCFAWRGHAQGTCGSAHRHNARFVFHSVDSRYGRSTVRALLKIPPPPPPRLSARDVSTARVTQQGNKNGKRPDTGPDGSEHASTRTVRSSSRCPTREAGAQIRVFAARAAHETFGRASVRCFARAMSAGERSSPTTCPNRGARLGRYSLGRGSA